MVSQELIAKWKAEGRTDLLNKFNINVSEPIRQKGEARVVKPKSEHQGKAEVHLFLDRDLFEKVKSRRQTISTIINQILQEYFHKEKVEGLDDWE
jgi:uncharacterized protein (DUF4415 family)